MEPPCETCKPEELFEENISAIQVFDRCGDEWITEGMEGTRIAISGPSIEAAMNVTGIFDQHERARVFDQVKTISRAVAKELIKESVRTKNAS